MIQDHSDHSTSERSWRGSNHFFNSRDLESTDLYRNHRKKKQKKNAPIDPKNKKSAKSNKRGHVQLYKQVIHCTVNKSYESCLDQYAAEAQHKRTSLG